MTEKFGKIWGTTTRIASHPSMAVYGLKILGGGECSEHRHEHRQNIFHVIDGELQITIWREARDAAGHEIAHPDRVILFAGDTTIVPCGVWHHFRAIQPTTAIEIYLPPDVDLNDIERRTYGAIQIPEGIK